MLPLVYPDLKRIACGYPIRQRPGHALEATALVHELCLRLRNQREVNYLDFAPACSALAAPRVAAFIFANPALAVSNGSPFQ